LPNNLLSFNDYLRKNFGIIQGGNTNNVCLKFSPSISNWINEQVWHPNQKVTFENDGSLIMKFPVADIFELKRMVLSHGSDIKVISPNHLANEIKKEINKMSDIY
jgi:predicted DNA-binding transcriptional regulator YafY